MKEISKDELKYLYENNDTKKVCEILGVTVPTLIGYLKRLGIKPRGRGNKRGGNTKIILKG